ncbi:MAG: hypothetical protein FWE71_12550 [Nocardioidaceae bacterium]|nr:hypothetical protein [Nocardioidaceae bacterium]MCL2613269.1 hypothetical protein [Nocardioidaceae bacterium]
MSSTAWIIVFAVFALVFIGVLLLLAAILDRRRVKDVHDHIPERSEGAFEHPHPGTGARDDRRGEP